MQPLHRLAHRLPRIRIVLRLAIVEDRLEHEFSVAAIVVRCGG